MRDTIPMDAYMEQFFSDQVELFSFEVLITDEMEVEIECGKADMVEKLEQEYGEDFEVLENAFVSLVGEHIGMNSCDFINDINELDVEDADSFMANFRYSDEVREDGKHPMYNFIVMLSQEREMEVTCGVSNEMMSLDAIYGELFAEKEELYMEAVANQILAHGFLFVKALESLG